MTAGMASAPPAPIEIRQRATSDTDRRWRVANRATRPITMDSWPVTTGNRDPNRLVAGPLARLAVMAKTAEGM